MVVGCVVYIRQIQVSLSCFRRAGSKMKFFFWFLCGSCLLWVFLLCCVPCFPSLSLFLSLSSLFRPFSFFFLSSLSFFPLFPFFSLSLSFLFLSPPRLFFVSSSCCFFFWASFFLLLFVFRLVSLSVSLAGFVCWLVLCLCWLKLLAVCHLFVTSFFLFFAAPVSNVVAAL